MAKIKPVSLRPILFLTPFLGGPVQRIRRLGKRYGFPVTIVSHKGV